MRVEVLGCFLCQLVWFGLVLVVLGFGGFLAYFKKNCFCPQNS